MPRQKRKNPNDCLIELRQRLEVLSQIDESVSEIGATIRIILSIIKGELKQLEKRICPQCGLIHSPYGTTKH